MEFRMLGMLATYLDGLWKAAVLTSAGTTWSVAGIELALGSALLAALARRRTPTPVQADRPGRRS